MAGLYIHIPFCRKLCYYCDFHFTVSFKHKEDLIKALLFEIEQRKEEFAEETFETIYFGGGTPSVLEIEEINSILDTIYRTYQLVSEPEITFESNPDDLTDEYLSDLKKHTSINRLSIGVQSFIDADLKLMNRRHSAKEAIKSIKSARKAGFNNINIDLIYGIHGMTSKKWLFNLDTFKSLELEHLSAYHLTIEPKTVFAHYQKKGKIKPINEDRSIEFFQLLLEFAGQTGYDHYEISNFARDGFYSRHNLAYWTGKNYLGIGPSAHSFLLNQRKYNIRNNLKYIESVIQGHSEHFETEWIDIRTSYNEYLLISLRTKWGLSKLHIREKFGKVYLSDFNINSQRFIADGTLKVNQNNVFLSTNGKLIADYIISELMVVD